MPIRNIVSIIGAVAVSTWAYSGVIERLNRIETTLEVKTEAIGLNSEFRINWPRGTMGALPSDASQNREIAQLQVELERVMEEVEENDTWIDEFDPRTEVKETYESVKDIQLRLAILEERISQLKTQ
jgi:hypothetical protein